MSPHEHRPPRSGDGVPDGPSHSRRRRGRAILVVLAAVALLGVAALTVAARAGQGPHAIPDPSPPTAVLPPEPTDFLEADHLRHDFGDVAITGAPVEALFTVRNVAQDPTRIVAAYTSCMCTTAVLDFPDGSSEGPFGMPGHELPVRLDRELGGDEALTVTVHFDPGAHGPDAIGPVERTVVLHAANGSSTTLQLVANVVAG